MKQPQRSTVRIRQSPKLPAETRQEQLLKAAHDLFMKKGYRATTTEAIARKAGLTKGAVYHHYRNKETILVELVKVVLDAYEAEMLKITDTNLSPADLFEKLRQIDEAMPMHEARHDPGLMAELLQLPRIAKLVNDTFVKNVEYLSECVDRRYGRTKELRRQLVIMTQALYDGLMLSSCMYQENIDIDKQAQAFRSLFKKGKSR